MEVGEEVDYIIYKTASMSQVSWFGLAVRR